MPELLIVIFLSLLAGLAIPVGGTLARVEHIRPGWLETDFRHGVLAFGGGVLLAAVALVLVPHGQKNLPLFWIVICFAGGGIAFMVLDIVLQRRDTPASNLAATLADYLPEALALGASFADNRSSSLLLALLIALQNFPEGFNAYREMNQSGRLKPRIILFTFLGASLLGPVAGVAGYTLLDTHHDIVGGITLFASGGILYIVVQDIAPQARLERRWGPPMGALLGFLFGLISQELIG